MSVGDTTRGCAAVGGSGSVERLSGPHSRVVSGFVPCGTQACVESASGSCALCRRNCRYAQASVRRQRCRRVSDITLSSQSATATRGSTRLYRRSQHHRTRQPATHPVPALLTSLIRIVDRFCAASHGRARMHTTRKPLAAQHSTLQRRMQARRHTRKTHTLPTQALRTRAILSLARTATDATPACWPQSAQVPRE